MALSNALPRFFHDSLRGLHGMFSAPNGTPNTNLNNGQTASLVVTPPSVDQNMGIVYLLYATVLNAGAGTCRVRLRLNQSGAANILPYIYINNPQTSAGLGSDVAPGTQVTIFQPAAIGALPDSTQGIPTPMPPIMWDPNISLLFQVTNDGPNAVTLVRWGAPFIGVPLMALTDQTNGPWS